MPTCKSGRRQTSRGRLPTRTLTLTLTHQAVEVSGDLKRPSPKRMLSAGSREMALPDAKHQAGSAELFGEHGEEDDDGMDD